jgi:predicted pyridoxine 5'-phosphate oxidase superfamily flavin-nucleotide-binding protein
MTTLDATALREAYPAPSERAVRKTLPALDHHMRRFISLSPFLCMGTSSDAGGDVTPRGDAPGFVHVFDDRTLLIPDWPGNNRLDSLSNVAMNPHVGTAVLRARDGRDTAREWRRGDQRRSRAAAAVGYRRQAPAIGAARDRTRSISALRESTDPLAVVEGRLQDRLGQRCRRTRRYSRSKPESRRQ